MRSLAATLVAVGVVTCAIPAQDLRYHVGLRVRAFERDFEAVLKDAKIRKRVCPTLERAVNSFFSMRLADVGRHMDEARHQLSNGKPGAAVQWADSVSLYPESRFLDRTVAALSFKLKEFYELEDAAPAGVRLRLTLLDAQGKTLAGPEGLEIEALPMSGRLPLKEIPAGDHRLRIEVRADDKTLVLREQTISFAKDLDKRLAKVLPLATADATDNETATMRGLARLLRTVGRKRTLETDVPATRLLAHVERLQQGTTVDEAGEGIDRLWLFTGKSSTAMRIFVPSARPTDDQKLPLVVAMHGAGGSENLFFDGYGAGKIVGLCKQRGWLLVTPRSGMFGRGSPTKALVDALAKIYPIDRSRVFALGHSMGAGQLMRDVSSDAGLFRAVAALGGGGSVRASKALQNLPIYVAPGDRDFALRGARRLKTTLQRANVKTLRYREYEATEHLGIVQVALDDVFAFFDAALKK